MRKKALVVWGGWEGHTPKESAELFTAFLRDSEYDVEVSQTLDSYLDKDKMNSLNLVVPVWTCGQITREQEMGLLQAVRSGVGIGGWHGCMCDSFRNNTEYQFMTGGQWVVHPGGVIPSYRVNIIKPDDEIVKGLDDFMMTNTEQYYMHADPSNEVLATTTFSGDYEGIDWIRGNKMPVVWKRMFGKGRVFYTSLGHTVKDFDVPQAREIVKRGLLWASQ
ncbi:ThuA domain-containing protein [Candidatus Sumerlaeota bacterium]|nr:ThuA domain-containing protein [Candidatus Sumerlaeota bacterium]